MSTYLFRQDPMNPRWFVPVVEFMVLRLIAGAAATLIVYATYVMFTH